MSTTLTDLDPHVRGDPFEYDFTLGNGWVFADFTGGMKFTLRTAIPPSSVVTDTDAVYQASIASGEITGSGTAGGILIPSSATTEWPGNKKLYWDLEGTVSGVVPRKHTIDRGTILIVGDVTRG